jgi:hypothetical protein
MIGAVALALAAAGGAIALLSGDSGPSEDSRARAPVTPGAGSTVAESQGGKGTPDEQEGRAGIGKRSAGGKAGTPGDPAGGTLPEQLGSCPPEFGAEICAQLADQAGEDGGGLGARSAKPPCSPRFGRERCKRMYEALLGGGGSQPPIHPRNCPPAFGGRQCEELERTLGGGG